MCLAKNKLRDIRHNAIKEYLPPVNYLHKWIHEDKKIMYNFGIATLAIKGGKYANNKLKQRLKLEATKNEFIDCYLNKLILKAQVIINCKNQFIIEYFKNKNKESEYDIIMRELDLLLDKPVQPQNIDKIRQEIINKKNEAILIYFNNVKKYKTMCPWSLKNEWKSVKHEQEFKYLYLTGIYRFHSQVGKDFYKKTGQEPWTIYKM